MRIFPILYKKTSTGKIQEWKIEVDSNIITTTFGQQNGKKQVVKEEIKSGVNLNKSNETTPEEQALSEAQATYTKKLKNGYVESLEDAVEGKIDNIITGGMLPMLAHPYSKQGDKIIYPAYANFKYDGHRCIAIKENGKWGLWSRTRKPITGLPHIIEALSNTDIDYILDGELYNHDYKDKFEELTHFIRQENPVSGHKVVQFHIYDIADPNLYQSKRVEILQSLKLETPLRCAPYIEVDNEEELMTTFEDMLALGYEGAMVRNRLGMYVNNRSYDLQKIKTFDDSEFKVVDVEEGKGSMSGKAIFICETKDKIRFGAKMIGSMSDLEKYIQNPELVVNKMVTIKYQGVTKNGIPRFPVCMRIMQGI